MNRTKLVRSLNSTDLKRKKKNLTDIVPIRANTSSVTFSSNFRGDYHCIHRGQRCLQDFKSHLLSKVTKQNIKAAFIMILQGFYIYMIRKADTSHF